MRFLLLLLAFILLPLAELYVLYRVGDAIGILPTLGLLLVDSVVGTILARSQGRAVWRRFNEAIAAGRAPAREVLDGALVILGGAFLLTPGFLTDLIGVSLLLPPTRALYRRLVLRRVERRIVSSLTAPPPAQQAFDVEGRAIDGDEAP